MDRTTEFHKLTGTSIGREALLPVAGSFMGTAQAQWDRLEVLRRAADRGDASTSEIHVVQDGVADLERQVEDLSDLGGRAPRLTRDQVAHRRGVCAILYEELKNLASRVQAEQVSELQREAEVASYFTAAPSSALRPKLKPPPGPAMDDLMGLSSSGYDAPRSAASEDVLRAEEQRLLNTFTTDLDKIQETRSKLEEVSAMMGLFSTKVAEQQEQAEGIHELTEQSVQHIEDANWHLNKAIQNSNSYRFYVVCWFLGSGMFLLVFDYLDSRFSFI